MSKRYLIKFSYTEFDATQVEAASEEEAEEKALKLLKCYDELEIISTNEIPDPDDTGKVRK